MELNIENNGFGKMHKDAQYWNGMLAFYQKDLGFAEKILSAKLFKPDIPNLLERLQEFNKRINDLKKTITEFSTQVQEHENEMQGLVECDTVSCDIIYQNRHLVMENHFKEKSMHFQSEKSKIFDYMGSILTK